MSSAFCAFEVDQQHHRSRALEWVQTNRLISVLKG